MLQCRSNHFRASQPASYVDFTWANSITHAQRNKKFREKNKNNLNSVGDSASFSTY